MNNTLQQSTDRVLALRNAGVLVDPFGVRVFAAIGRVANVIIDPANGYAEEHRVIAKSILKTHTEQMVFAEGIATSILHLPQAGAIEAMEDDDLLQFITVFARRYFGLSDVPEAAPVTEE